jgi:hypothetical protein
MSRDFSASKRTSGVEFLVLDHVADAIGAPFRVHTSELAKTTHSIVFNFFNNTINQPILSISQWNIDRNRKLKEIHLSRLEESFTRC